MPQLDWHVVLTGLLYAALTGVFNLIFANKSAINEWAESNPRLAGILKITRAFGLDPQHLWAAGALIVKGRLPKVQTEPLPEKANEKVRIIPPGPLLVLLVAGLVFSQTRCNPAKPPCDENQLRAIDAAYLEQVGRQCLQYASVAECPALPGLRAQHSRDLKAVCP